MEKLIEVIEKNYELGGKTSSPKFKVYYKKSKRKSTEKCKYIFDVVLVSDDFVSFGYNLNETENGYMFTSASYKSGDKFYQYNSLSKDLKDEIIELLTK